MKNDLSRREFIKAWTVMLGGLFNTLSAVSVSAWDPEEPVTVFQVRFAKLMSKAENPGSPEDFVDLVKRRKIPRVTFNPLRQPEKFSKMMAGVAVALTEYCPQPDFGSMYGTFKDKKVFALSAGVKEDKEGVRESERVSLAYFNAEGGSPKSVVCIRATTLLEGEQSLVLVAPEDAKWGDGDAIFEKLKSKNALRTVTGLRQRDPLQAEDYDNMMEVGVNLANVTATVYDSRYVGGVMRVRIGHGAMSFK